MKALIIHIIVIASTLIGGDLTFNSGRDSTAFYREVMPHAIVNDGRRAAYHFTNDVTRFIDPVIKKR